MAKNIVVLLDGTSNEISANRTNILRLYGTLEKSDRQLVYYDPGVGTFGAENAWLKFWRKAVEIWGMATGWGLDQNVKEAYRFLVENYDNEPWRDRKAGRPGPNLYLWLQPRRIFRAGARRLYSRRRPDREDATLISSTTPTVPTSASVRTPETALPRSASTSDSWIPTARRFDFSGYSTLSRRSSSMAATGPESARMHSRRRTAVSRPSATQSPLMSGGQCFVHSVGPRAKNTGATRSTKAAAWNRTFERFGSPASTATSAGDIRKLRPAWRNCRSSG